MSMQGEATTPVAAATNGIPIELILSRKEASALQERYPFIEVI